MDGFADLILELFPPQCKDASSSASACMSPQSSPSSSSRRVIFSLRPLLVASSSRCVSFSSRHLLVASSSRRVIFSSRRLLVASSSHCIIFSLRHLLVASAMSIKTSVFSPLSSPVAANYGKRTAKRRQKDGKKTAKDRAFVMRKGCFHAAGPDIKSTSAGGVPKEVLTSNLVSMLGGSCSEFLADEVVVARL